MATIEEQSLEIEHEAITEAMLLADDLHQRKVPVLTGVAAAAMLQALTVVRIARDQPHLDFALARLGEATRALAVELLAQRTSPPLQ